MPVITVGHRKAGCRREVDPRAFHCIGVRCKAYGCRAKNRISSNAWVQKGGDARERTVCAPDCPPTEENISRRFHSYVRPAHPRGHLVHVLAWQWERKESAVWNRDLSFDFM